MGSARAVGSRRLLADVRIALVDQTNSPPCPVPSSDEMLVREEVCDNPWLASGTQQCGAFWTETTHTTECPSSGTVLLTLSHPFPKQVWPHTLQSDQPRKPLRLATLVKVIGRGREGCPHAGLGDGEQSISTHSNPSPATEVGRNPSRKWCKPPFLLPPRWARWAEEPRWGSLAASHRSFPSGSPAPSAPACCGTWDPPPARHTPLTSTRERSKGREVLLLTGI